MERKKVLLLLFCIIILVLSVYIVLRKAYVIGARDRCRDNGMILNEDFECEEVKENNIGEDITEVFKIDNI